MVIGTDLKGRPSPEMYVPDGMVHMNTAEGRIPVGLPRAGSFEVESRMTSFEDLVEEKFRQVDAAIRFFQVALLVAVAVMVAAVVWLATQIPT